MCFLKQQNKKKEKRRLKDSIFFSNGHFTKVVNTFWTY